MANGEIQPSPNSSSSSSTTTTTVATTASTTTNVTIHNGPVPVLIEHETNNNNENELLSIAVDAPLPVKPSPREFQMPATLKAALDYIPLTTTTTTPTAASTRKLSLIQNNSEKSNAVDGFDLPETTPTSSPSTNNEALSVGAKRKRENRASTYDFNTFRHEYTKDFGGTPWKTDEKIYSFGLRGYVRKNLSFRS